MPSTTPPPLDLPRLSTAQEIHSATGIPVARLYELCRLNQIPHIKVGRSTRFDPKAVLLWLRAGGTAAKGGED